MTAIVIQTLIVLVIIRRAYSMTQGVPYSAPRLVALPVLILILWVFSELESILLTPWALPYLIALDSAVLIGGVVAFTPIAERMTRVERDASGNWSYRIGFSLAAVFVGAFVIRLGLAVALFPSSLEFGGPHRGYPPLFQQIILAVIDALFSMSAGLLVARSVGIQRKWKAARAGQGLSGAP